MLLLGLFMLQAQPTDRGPFGLRQAIETAVGQVFAAAGRVAPNVRDAKTIYVSVPSFTSALGADGRGFPTGWPALGKAAGSAGISSLSDVTRCGSGSTQVTCFALRDGEIVIRADSVVRGPTSMCAAITVGWSAATPKGVRRGGGILYEVRFERSAGDLYMLKVLHRVPPVFVSAFPQKHGGPAANRQVCSSVANG
jgi:hypothetical protein